MELGKLQLARDFSPATAARLSASPPFVTPTPRTQPKAITTQTENSR